MDETRVKRWYENSIWTEEMVRLAVKKGALTLAQYKNITGKNYIKR